LRLSRSNSENVMSEDPRPATISTRPGAIAAAVAICSKTRSGSSVDSTVTVVPSPIRRVEAAAALTSDVGDDSGIDGVWCSPKPKKSSPTCSATCTASSTFRIA
jgi:hypothetical protein